MAKLASKTYGEALFSLFLEEDILAVEVEEVMTLRQVLAESEELSMILNHPQVTKEEKKELVENVFKGRISDDLTGFLILIIEKNRYHEMDSIFQYFVDKVKKYQNIGIAYVVSAFPLDEGQKKSIESRLLATTEYVRLEMNYLEDPGLIGGLVIRIGDRVVDSSIRTEINTMARELSNIQLTESY